MSRDELEVAKVKAETATVAKSEFLAAMSHEIRTPMTGVLGLADILLDDDNFDEKLSPARRETVLKIKGAGQALITILNDILDLSKIQAGKIEIEYIDFNLRALIADSLELFYPTASGKSIALSAKIDPALPVTVNGDPTRIRQVLVNLLGNAVKFTDRGSVSLDATVSASRDGGATIRFAVIDTGIGIAGERQQVLFEDFTQLDASTARKYQGTGLGLSISKRLTELMGGDIGIDSVEGEGATFWFTIPVTVSETTVAAPALDASNGEYRAVRPLRILLAEDNDLNQMIISAVLSKFGHAITVVDDGRAAIEAVRAGDFDVVLMDVRMPDMDGPDATRIIRQESNVKSAIPIIAVTADAVVENRESFIASGMNAVVTKPIDRLKLIQAINEVLNEEVHVQVPMSI